MILRAIKELTLDNILALRGRETEETNGIYPNPALRLLCAKDRFGLIVTEHQHRPVTNRFWAAEHKEAAGTNDGAFDCLRRRHHQNRVSCGIIPRVTSPPQYGCLVSALS